jgi:predicted nucleic acid-binding Zn ribbon protein
MPTYEYRCEANGRIVEVQHKMSEQLTTWGELCSRAGISVGQTSPSAPVQKLISASFIGTGSATSAPVCEAPGCGSGACGGGMCAFD